MGINIDPNTGTSEIVGDELEREQAKRRLGRPHRDTPFGRRVSQCELDEIDRFGE